MSTSGTLIAVQSTLSLFSDSSKCHNARPPPVCPQLTGVNMNRRNVSSQGCLSSLQSSTRGLPLCTELGSLLSKRSNAIKRTTQSKYLGKTPPANAAASGASVSAGDGPGVAPAAVNAGTGSFILAIAIPLIAGAIVSSINKPTSDWYRSLKKPSWNPPDALFGTVWSVLYATMGYSAWLVWKQGGWQAQQGPLTLYVVQLVLNLLWPMICFGAKNLGLALVDILALLAGILATIQAFKPVDPFAAQLLWPYLAWVTFATALNYNLWRNNRGGSAQPPPGTYAGGRGYAS